MARTVKVKICGIMHLDDALEACRLGADALGFIFYEKSPRYVAPSQVADITRHLPPFITTIGVFVNASPDHVQAVREVSGITTVQLHGEESPLMCRETGGTVIKAFRTGGDFNPDAIRFYDGVQAVLLDAYDKEAYGGTGKPCDWDTAAKLAKVHRLILAGGIGPDNVVEAVHKVKPYAIDVSSGVECDPGRKDHRKMKKLFEVLER